MIKNVFAFCQSILVMYYEIWLESETKARVKSSVPWAHCRLQPARAFCLETDSPHSWNYGRKSTFPHSFSTNDTSLKHETTREKERQERPLTQWYRMSPFPDQPLLGPRCSHRQNWHWASCSQTLSCDSPNFCWPLQARREHRHVWMLSSTNILGSRSVSFKIQNGKAVAYRTATAFTNTPRGAFFTFPFTSLTVHCSHTVMLMFSTWPSVMSMPVTWPFSPTSWLSV